MGRAHRKYIHYTRCKTATTVNTINTVLMLVWMVMLWIPGFHIYGDFGLASQRVWAVVATILFISALLVVLNKVRLEIALGVILASVGWWAFATVIFAIKDPHEITWPLCEVVALLLAREYLRFFLVWSLPPYPVSRLSPLRQGPGSP